jgi:hypothetical protein
MHNRKTFFVYPPGYDPHNRGNYKEAKSLYQAKKLARRMGHGAEIDESIHRHMAARKRWFSSYTGRVWVH